MYREKVRPLFTGIARVERLAWAKPGVTILLGEAHHFTIDALRITQHILHITQSIPVRHSTIAGIHAG